MPIARPIALCLLALIVAGCPTPTPQPGPEGPQGPLGPQGPAGPQGEVLVLDGGVVTGMPGASVVVTIC